MFGGPVVVVLLGFATVITSLIGVVVATIVLIQAAWSQRRARRMESNSAEGESRTCGAESAFDAEIAEAGKGFCAYLYHKGGVAQPDLVCPDDVMFTVRLASHLPRKARRACAEHLAEVIWQLMRDYGEASWNEKLKITAMPVPWAHSGSEG